MAEANSGAYRLCFRLLRPVAVEVGRLGLQRLPAGDYVYVGSARRGLRQRLARHERLLRDKQGRLHWHIDYLLVHPASRFLRAEAVAGGDECRLGRALARRPGVSVPVPGFGATDCRRGCAAHLYRLSGDDGGRA